MPKMKELLKFADALRAQGKTYKEVCVAIGKEYSFESRDKYMASVWWADPEPKVQYVYRVFNDSPYSTGAIVILDAAAGQIEQDLPAIKDAMRRMYGESATVQFRIIEYLGYARR